MSAQNPFATTPIAASTAVASDVQVLETTAAVAEVATTTTTAAPLETPSDTSVEAVVGEKVKKAKKPRDPNKPKSTNKKMEEGDKVAIITRYQKEDIGAIAASLGYTRSQAYNVIRNTRVDLNTELETNTDMSPEKRAKIEKVLVMVSGKEFGGAKARTATGEIKTASEKIDDILSMLLA